MGNARTVQISVVYARADVQTVIPLGVAVGTTIAQAIEQSGITARFAEIDLTQQRVGIFGKLAQLQDEVKEGDRVEIYRALLADPKETRRRRAALAKKSRVKAPNINRR